MNEPQRIQLQRTKGWKMPPNTVKVDRTTVYGNPWTVASCGFATDAVHHYRRWIEGDVIEHLELQRRRILAGLSGRLVGVNLACWCKPGAPCHADVLLEMANRQENSAPGDELARERSASTDPKTLTSQASGEGE